MSTHQKPDALNTRIVLWSYAVLMTAAGITTLSMPLPPATKLPGACLIAFALLAMPLAGVDDPCARRRGLLWVALTHVAVSLAVMLLGRAALGEANAEFVFTAALISVFILLYLWATVQGEGERGQGLLTTVFGGNRNTTERLRSEYELRIKEAAASEERHRLARDLHDSVKQQIFAIHSAAATAQTRFETDPAGARDALELVRDSARQAMSQMEAMIGNLQAAPLESAGLVEALRNQCEALGFRTGARVELRPLAVPAPHTLAPGAADALFRVAQEALANVARHSRAANVLVTLDATPQRVILQIKDDGRGFDPDRTPRGMGLANMRARAMELDGILEIHSRPGAGALLTFTLPIVFSADDWKDYRQKTIYAVCSFAICLPLAIVMKSFGAAFWTGITAVGIIRYSVAWRRARRLAGDGQ